MFDMNGNMLLTEEAVSYIAPEYVFPRRGWGVIMSLKNDGILVKPMSPVTIMGENDEWHEIDDFLFIEANEEGVCKVIMA